MCAAVVLRLAVLPAVVAAASFGCAILVSMFVTPLTVTRYFQFGQIILLVAIALAAVQIPQRRWRMSTVGILVVLSVATLWLLPSKADLAKRPGLSALVRKVLSQRQNDESVLVASPYMFHATRFHVQHSSGGDNVQVILIRNNRQLLHYSGGPVIRPTAILLPMELDQGTLSSAWLINVAEFSPWMEDVARLLADGRLGETDQIRSEPSGDWQTADSVIGLLKAAQRLRAAHRPPIPRPLTIAKAAPLIAATPPVITKLSNLPAPAQVKKSIHLSEFGWLPPPCCHSSSSESAGLRGPGGKMPIGFHSPCI